MRGGPPDIADAISDNALNWRRADNVLFIDDSGSGLLRFYVETAKLQIKDFVVHHFGAPTQTDEHLAKGQPRRERTAKPATN